MEEVGIPLPQLTGQSLLKVKSLSMMTQDLKNLHEEHMSGKQRIAQGFKTSKPSCQQIHQENIGQIQLSKPHISGTPPPGFSHQDPRSQGFRLQAASFAPQASPPLPQLLAGQIQQFAPPNTPITAHNQAFEPRRQPFSPHKQVGVPRIQVNAQPQLQQPQPRRHISVPAAYARHNTQNNSQSLTGRRQERIQFPMTETSFSNPRHRTLSPADIYKLAEQAERRNRARGLITPPRITVTPARINSPSVLQPHNILGTGENFPPLAMTQSAKDSSLAQTKRPPVCAVACSYSEFHGTWTRTVDRGPAYDVTPENDQDAAAAARSHAERVRSMQRQLAADPNIIISPAPSISTQQLTAQGPPLTATTANHPSVLTPVVRTPLMTYQQAFDAIIGETGPLLLRLELLEPVPVTALLYDDSGSSLGVSEALVLNKETDLKTLVMVVQKLLDEQIKRFPGHDGQRFIITHIDVRNGDEIMKAGHPPLKGEAREKSRTGKSAAWVRWMVNGDMEKYWKVLRIELQTGAPQPGDKKPVVRPIFKVKTVRQTQDHKRRFLNGHEFVDVATLESLSATCQSVDRGKDDNGEYGGNHSSDISSESTGDHFATLSLGVHERQFGGRAPVDSMPNCVAGDDFESKKGIGKLNFGGDGAHSTTGSATDGCRNNERPSKQTSPSINDEAAECNKVEAPEQSNGEEPASSQARKKPNTEAFNPSPNWVYYQTMGGDPKNWKTYDLSHLPFQVENYQAPALKFDPVATREVLARNYAEGWNDREPETSLSPRYSPLRPIAYSGEEQAWLDKATRDLETATSFGDDHIFFPNHNTQIPRSYDILDACKVHDTQKIVASRLMGASQQNSAKGKSKETRTRDFFRTSRTPNRSRDQVGSCDEQKKGDNETGSVMGSNSPLGGHIVRGGQDNMDQSHSEVDHYDSKGKGKATMANDGNFGASDVSQDRIGRVVSRHATSFNESNMLQSTKTTATTTTKPNSPMNVHAADFAFNYPQPTDQPGNNMLSPYLQSLLGPQPSYARSNLHRQMPSQVGWSAPITAQKQSPVAAGNQVLSMQKSNFSTAVHLYEFPNIGSQTVNPKQSSSSMPNSPDKKYARNTNISTGPQSKFYQNAMLNTGSTGSSPENPHFPRTGSSFIALRHHSPDRQFAQPGMSQGQTQHSPGKINPTERSRFPLLRCCSPEKSGNQHDQGSGFLSDLSNQQYPPQDFQYDQATQYNFDFQFHG